MAWIVENSEVTLDRSGKSIILLFLRNAETNKMKTQVIERFRPYFYVHGEEDRAVYNCFNERVKRVFVNNHYEMKSAREQYPYTFDADVPLDMRYRIDKGIKYAVDDHLIPIEYDGIKIPRIVYFDIEVSSERDIFPEPEKADYPIVVISAFDSYAKEPVVFTLNARQVLDNSLQFNYSSESELLRGFSDWIYNINPDVLTGWYSEGFDVPYIRNRATKIGADITGFSRHAYLKINQWSLFPGRSHLDLQAVFIDWSKPLGQMESYALKFISAQPEFGDFVYDDYGIMIKEMIENDEWEKIVEYSMNDVIALQRINEKCGLISFYEGVRKLVGIKLIDVAQKTRIVEYNLMHEFKNPLPTRQKNENMPFAGAFVLSPEPGIHEDVAGFDVAALYPTIIVSYDISPDAFSMIPKSILGLMAEREKLRAMRLRGEGGSTLKTTEQSLKYIINSYYGVIGYSGFKMYNPEVAASIPSKGQEIIKVIASFINKCGYDVCYGDTDSCYCKPIRSVEEGLELESKINSYMLVWLKRDGGNIKFPIKIKMEQMFRTIMYKLKNNSTEAARKRYIGHLIWEDGKEVDKLYYKGLELKRSDAAPITKETMTKFFNILLVEGNREKAFAYIRKTMLDIEQGRVDILKCAIPKAIRSTNRTSPHQRGLQNTKQLLGISLDRHMKPKLLYTTRPVKELCIDDNINIEQVQSVCSIDWKTMAQKTIKNKFKSYLTSLGVSWDEVIDMQSNLTRWM